MTKPPEGSLFDDYAASSEGARELAAVDLASQAARLIRQAMDNSPMDQRALAAILGVTEGRVSQVVNGDGNLRVAAIAKYMRVLGYITELVAHPVEVALPELPQKSVGRPCRRLPIDMSRTEDLPSNVIPFVPREAHFNHAYVAGANRGSKTESERGSSVPFPLVYEQ